MYTNKFKYGSWLAALRLWNIYQRVLITHQNVKQKLFENLINNNELLMKLSYPHKLRERDDQTLGLFRFCFKEGTLYVYFFMRFLKVVFLKRQK